MKLKRIVNQICALVLGVSMLVPSTLSSVNISAKVSKKTIIEKYDKKMNSLPINKVQGMSVAHVVKTSIGLLLLPPCEGMNGSETYSIYKYTGKKVKRIFKKDCGVITFYKKYLLAEYSPRSSEYSEGSNDKYKCYLYKYKGGKYVKLKQSSVKIKDPYNERGGDSELMSKCLSQMLNKYKLKESQFVHDSKLPHVYCKSVGDRNSEWYSYSSFTELKNGCDGWGNEPKDNTNNSNVQGLPSTSAFVETDNYFKKKFASSKCVCQSFDFNMPTKGNGTRTVHFVLKGSTSMTNFTSYLYYKNRNGKIKKIAKMNGFPSFYSSDGKRLTMINFKKSGISLNCYTVKTNGYVHKPYKALNLKCKLNYGKYDKQSQNVTIASLGSVASSSNRLSKKNKKKMLTFLKKCKTMNEISKNDVYNEKQL